MVQSGTKEMKMLDIGVGGGRTTVYFGPLVGDYTGIDYSQGMIRACKKRFKAHPEYEFLKCDVRDLKGFGDSAFDLVLFSFNGLDYVSHEERIGALKEIRRVVKQDGYFIFSSHNLQCIKDLYRFRFTLHPRQMLLNIVNYPLNLWYNGGLRKYLKLDYAVINDGAHGLGLRTYYVRPLEQVAVLRRLGFEDVRVFSVETGVEILERDFGGIGEVWVYYFCRSIAQVSLKDHKPG
jgi:SAM-dependent methyltransferase